MSIALTIRNRWQNSRFNKPQGFPALWLIVLREATASYTRWEGKAYRIWADHQLRRWSWL